MRARREESSHQTLPDAQITRLSSTSMQRKCVVSRPEQAASCQPGCQRRLCDRALLAEPLPSRRVIARPACRKRRRLEFSRRSSLPFEAFPPAKGGWTKPEAPRLMSAPTAGACSPVIPGSLIETPCKARSRPLSAATGRRCEAIAAIPSSKIVQSREKSLVSAKLRRPHNILGLRLVA